MKFDFKLIVDKMGLIDFKGQILDLFRCCFGKDLDEKIWLWAYINNTFSNPIVSLSFKENKLVGHYAVIPVATKRGDKQIKTCLSMTTMVEIHYRKHGIFYEQARQVYKMAKELGFQIVIGFPNKKSLPGFKKRLGWECDASDYVAVLTKGQLLSSKSFQDYLLDEELIELDTENKEFLEWRLSKPQQNYYIQDGNIIKDFEHGKDIVFINKRYREALDKNKKFNILIDTTIDDFRDYMVFEYQFGFKLLDEKFKNLKFKKDLLMSDVF